MAVAKYTFLPTPTGTQGGVYQAGMAVGTIYLREAGSAESSEGSKCRKLNSTVMLLLRGLLDRSTARYFYKRLKTSLHKPRGNFVEILFYKKCAFKNNLQLLEKKVFVSNKYIT
jgi:hypothetical protein